MTGVRSNHRAGGRRAREFVIAAAVASVAAALAQAAPAGRQAHRVEIKDVAFVPAQVTIRAGDGVEWDNGDIVAHTATSEEGGFDVDLPSGVKGGAVMTRPGTFGYICRYHPTMTGRIVVRQ